MELLMLVFLIVGASRWAKKHDRTLLTKEEYDEIWRNSPYRHYRGIVDDPTYLPPKDPPSLPR